MTEMTNTNYEDTFGMVEGSFSRGIKADSLRKIHTCNGGAFRVALRQTA